MGIYSPYAQMISAHDGKKIMGYKTMKHGEFSPHRGITMMGYWDF
jgi:hypothetical protein